MGHIKTKNKTHFISSKILIAGALVAASMLSAFTQAAQAASNETITVTYPYYAFIEDPDDPWATVWDALDSTDTYEYTDDYFAESSPGVHEKLRTMSYALALAGFENQADGYPSESSETNPKLQDLLSQMGFSDYQNWDAASDADGHSFGTSIAHKTITYDTDSGEETKELIVVAPRNYNYMTEWLSNFDVGTSGDHEGFSESADLVISRLNSYLDTYDLSNYKIWMVGYSRGGAVVDLAAKKINQNLSSYDMAADGFYAYTFGAPRASVTEPQYTNIHDVKDGNDLLLGYVYPEEWGFYNTGTYEEIHPANLTITASVIDITDLADPAKAIQVLIDNVGVTVDVGTVYGKDFMDGFLAFATESGLTREYFNSTVRPPLSDLMQVYQSRTLDTQSEVTDFISSTDGGMLGMIAANAFTDLTEGGYGETLEEALANFPVYQDLIKVLRGTATSADISELADNLKQYMGDYDDYEDFFGVAPDVTEAEFAVIKESLPELIEALGPIIVADAEYTAATYGENMSLYYTLTLVNNAWNLVYGHIPESIMPILKSLVPDDPDDPVTPSDDPTSDDDSDENLSVPDTGAAPRQSEEKSDSAPGVVVEILVPTAAAVIIIWTARRVYLARKK